MKTRTRIPLAHVASHLAIHLATICGAVFSVFPACLQGLVSRPMEDDYARIKRLNAERDAIAARKARHEEAKRVSCSEEVCRIWGARNGCYHRAACSKCMFLLVQEAVVH